MKDVTFRGGGRPKVTLPYKPIYYNKKGDKGEGGVKNLKMEVTSFMNGPIHGATTRILIIYCTIILFFSPLWILGPIYYILSFKVSSCVLRF